MTKFFKRLILCWSGSMPQLAQAQLKGRMTRKLMSQLVYAKCRERELVGLTQDIKTLLQWLSHDVL